MIPLRPCVSPAFFTADRCLDIVFGLRSSVRQRHYAVTVRFLARKLHGLLAVFGSSLVIFFIAPGSASAGDATAILRPAAACDRAGCVQEPESCRNNCVLLPNRAALPALSLAQQLNDNLLIDLTAPKPTNLEGTSKEATNGKRQMRYMTSATDAAEPSRAETPQPHW